LQQGVVGESTDALSSTLLKPDCEELRSLWDSMACVQVAGKWGYIAKTGKFKIPAQFDLAWSFCEGLAGVKSGGRWSYIDKNGKFLYPR
jgi:hypothetical protein